MFPPNKILVVSDSNELELRGSMPVTKNQKEVVFTYLYTKSNTKGGDRINFNESELKKYLDNKIFKEL